MSQTVILMRHGEASPHSFGGDAARELTEFGQQQVRLVASGLLETGVEVSEIWHSPYVRAVQTAALMAEGLGVNRLVENPSLTPDSHPAAVIDSIRNAETGLMVVSHLPLIPELARLLLGGNSLHQFSTASIGLFDISPGESPKIVSFWKPNNWPST
jgi:phosphohistidine phosphatase